MELYRETGERRYLDLAGYFVDRHGHGLLGGEAYCQDRVPLREADERRGPRGTPAVPAGRRRRPGRSRPATRNCAAAGERLWQAMAATKTHLTGGLGAHHDEEDFGDPYELPNERAYCETCAAVASVQFSWRMALLTGEARYSDLIERTLFNGFLAGVSLDGESWLYVNPLQVRDGHTDAGRRPVGPPHPLVPLRLLPAQRHAAARQPGALLRLHATARGLQIHQYATGRFTARPAATPLTVSANTDYPWHGRTAVTVEETPGDRPWTLSLRIPQWCTEYTASAWRASRPTPPVDGRLAAAGAVLGAGDEVVLELDARPRA